MDNLHSPELAAIASAEELKRMESERAALKKVLDIHTRWMAANEKVDEMAELGKYGEKSNLYINQRQRVISSSEVGSKLVQLSRDYRDQKAAAGYEHSGFEMMSKRHQELFDKLESMEYQELLERFQEFAPKLDGQLPLPDPDFAQLKTEMADILQADWQKSSGYPERWKPVGSNVEFVAQRLALLQDPNQREKILKTFKIFDAQGKAVDLDQFAETFDVTQPWPEGFSAKEDIQHLPNRELSPKSAAQNNAGAEAPLNFLHESLQKKEPITPEWLEKAAEAVHKSWLARNGWVNDPVEKPVDDADEQMRRNIQKLNYNDSAFDEEQKNRDRRPVVLAMELYAKKIREKQQ